MTRGRYFGFCGVSVAGVLLLLSIAATARATVATATFVAPGDHSFTVPAGVHEVTVVAVGARGGDCGDLSHGGLGASVAAEVPVSPDEPLFVGVAGPGDDCPKNEGAGGVGGGGRGGLGGVFSTGGGGASSVAAGSSFPSVQGPLVVAGGGGGAGGGDLFAGTRNDGANAGAGAPSGLSGGAGTLSDGGRGGSGGSAVGDGQPGALGRGGAGGNAFTTQCYTGAGGGGGGGGYYGGGGGGACKDNLSRVLPSSDNGAGGGGSSFVTATGATVFGPEATTAAPGVSLTYAAPKEELNATSIRFGEEATGAVSNAQILTVHNAGSAPLLVSGVLVGGSDPDDFIIDNRCLGPVAVGASCQIEVRFAPARQAIRAATLRLLSNAAITPGPVKLSGGTPGQSLRAHHELTRRSALVSCPTLIAGERRHRAGTAVCTARNISGEFEFTHSRGTVGATLTRGRLTYAAGVWMTAADGSPMLMLDEHRKLWSGAYTLVLRARRGGRRTTKRERVVVRLTARAAKAPRLGASFSEPRRRS